MGYDALYEMLRQQILALTEAMPLVKPLEEKALRFSPRRARDAIGVTTLRASHFGENVFHC